jgi:hypothetical protein
MQAGGRPCMTSCVSAHRRFTVYTSLMRREA